MENKIWESNALLVNYIWHKNLYSKYLQIWLIKTKVKKHNVTIKEKSIKNLNGLMFTLIY